MGEQLDVLLGELARRGGVQHDHADHVARRARDRHGGHRLPALLLELGEVLHARVVERLVADQRGAACCAPPSRSRPRRSPSRSGRRTRGARATPRAAPAGRRRRGRSGTRGEPVASVAMSTTPASTSSISSVENTVLMTARRVTASSRPPMCTSHTLFRAGPATDAIAGPRAARLYHCSMAIETSPSADQLRAELDGLGVEFVFAQFVDMHGKPNAKLVPVAHLEGLLDRRRRVRRLRGRRHRPGPARSGHRRDARRAHADPRCRGSRRSRASPATSPSRASRGRTARARSCATSSPAPRSSGYDFKIGCELEYFLVRKREDGAIELADPLDDLDQPCYDMRALTRSLGFVTDVARHVNALGWDIYATDHEDANGQFEQNFQYDDALITLRPRDLLPLHGRVARAGARADRDVHAEAVRAPDRQRLPLPHEPVGRRAQRVRRPTRPTTRAGSG